MTDLKNELSWSKSREDVFSHCKRQYYFRYYASWGGWEEGVDPRVRELYVLSKLKTRQMWAGEVVHECIERTLKNIEAGIDPLPVDEIVAITKDRMRADFRSSREGHYREKPKSCALAEHEFGLKVPDSDWKELATHVELCLRHFYRSELYAEIRALPIKNWLELEKLASFPLDGIRVNVKLDFAFRRGEEVVIADWKTNKKAGADNSRQMGCYAFYAQGKWGLPPERIQTLEFNLPTGKVLGRRPSAADMSAVESFIRGSIADMKKLLADPLGNSPKAEADFAYTDDAKTCSRCNFRRICPGSKVK